MNPNILQKISDMRMNFWFPTVSYLRLSIELWYESTQARLNPSALRCNMPRMQCDPLRVVCHAVLRIDLVPASVQRLRRDVESLCAQKGAQLIDVLVDAVESKEPRDRLSDAGASANGLADVLLVVRTLV